MFRVWGLGRKHVAAPLPPHELPAATVRRSLGVLGRHGRRRGSNAASSLITAVPTSASLASTPHDARRPASSAVAASMSACARMGSQARRGTPTRCASSAGDSATSGVPGDSAAPTLLPLSAPGADAASSLSTGCRRCFLPQHRVPTLLPPSAPGADAASSLSIGCRRCFLPQHRVRSGPG